MTDEERQLRIQLWTELTTTDNAEVSEYASERVAELARRLKRHTN